MRILEHYLYHIKGSAAIEFAFILPVFLALVFGSIELGYLFWAQSALNYGATFGARYAFIHPTASTSAIQSAALDSISFPNSAISYTVTSSAGDIDIDGSMTYSFLILPLSPITLTIHEHQVIPLPS